MRGHPRTELVIHSYEALIIGAVVTLWAIACLVLGRLRFCVIVKCIELSRQRNAVGYWVVIGLALAFGVTGVFVAFR